MNFSKKAAVLLCSLGLIVGVIGTVSLQARATSTTTDQATVTATEKTVDTRPSGHAPLGGDGNVTAINGTTITMQEEANEGGASYVVDASQATVTNNGVNAALSDVKVGDKIFVQGTTNGTNVTATSISLGHPGRPCKAPSQSN